MDTDETPDVRLVYLALHHMMKHRGHFLFSGNIENIKEFQETFRQYVKSIRDEELDFDLCIEDEELIIQNPEEKQKLKALFSFNTKVDLCRGLDELIDFYRDWDKGRG